MSELAAAGANSTTASALKDAVFQHKALSRQGLLERAFATVFDNLVYPQIWEDPVVDMKALSIRPGDHVVSIASGGCNVMSYLTGDPARVTAVDLNTSHLALTRLKIAAAQHAPGYTEFRQLFAEAGSRDNKRLFDEHLAPVLDPETHRYWSGRTLRGQRRIDMFSRNFYRRGVLGRCILAGHVVAKLYGVNPAGMMHQLTLGEQKAFFAQRLSPLFDRKGLRWLMLSPISLYGLGIPPAQYQELAEGRHMADVVRERLGRLACDHPLRDNYFARQAFGRCYGLDNPDAALPPYLEERNWKLVSHRANRIRTVHGSVTEFLARQPARSVNKVVLLDAQDWMTDQQMNELWRAISDASAPGARVIFRTAGRRSPLESHVDASVMARWQYDKQMSDQYLAEDRSGIYGGFHLYRKEA